MVMQYTIILEIPEEGGHTTSCLELSREPLNWWLKFTRKQARVLGEIAKVDVANAW